MAVFIDGGLLLCSTFIRHDAVPRDAAVTYAVDLANGDLTDATALANQIQLEFTNHWAAQIDAGAVIDRTEVQYGTNSETTLVGVSTSAGVRGARGGDGVYPNCAVLVRKNTGMGGRRNQGRLFMPFCARQSDVTEDGKIGSGAVATLQGVAEAWRADVAGGELDMVIANRIYDAPATEKIRHLLNVTIGAPVLSLTVESTLATQRKRMVR
jgi:hypothetical protein